MGKVKEKTEMKGPEMVTLYSKVGRADWKPVRSYQKNDEELTMKVASDKAEAYRQYQVSGCGTGISFSLE